VKPGYVLLFIAGAFLLAGYVETHEPHVMLDDCTACHMPNLNTYSAYAKAWPSPAERNKK
jgi:hypothetical protein